MPHELRARVGPDLLAHISREYGLTWSREPEDLGGFNNLNVLLATTRGELVARVYAPWVTEARVGAIQTARSALLDGGLPVPETIAAADGAALGLVNGRVVEVEEYIAGENMDLGDRLRAGMPYLGRVHSILATVNVVEDGKRAPHSNQVDPENVLVRAARASEDLRAGHPGLADLADQVAARVHAAESPLLSALPRQLVHGDFWDNNVLFRGNELVVILDLDFMGERVRVDDLALTLYYVTSTLAARGSPPTTQLPFLRELIDLYDEGLATRLSSEERAALPIAIARTALAILGHSPDIADSDARANFIDEMRPDIDWSADLMRDLDEWQVAFEGG